MISITIAASIIGLGTGLIVGRLTSGAGKLATKLGRIEGRWTEREEHLRIQRRKLYELRDELAELRAWKSKVLSGLNKATAARHAAKLKREAEARALTATRHAELRSIVGDIV